MALCDRRDEAAFILAHAMRSPLLHAEIRLLARVPNVIFVDLLVATVETPTQDIEGHSRHPLHHWMPTTYAPGLT